LSLQEGLAREVTSERAPVSFWEVELGSVLVKSISKNTNLECLSNHEIVCIVKDSPSVIRELEPERLEDNTTICTDGLEL